VLDDGWRQVSVLQPDGTRYFPFPYVLPSANADECVSEAPTSARRVRTASSRSRR
jgi:hypothetical protein